MAGPEAPRRVQCVGALVYDARARLLLVRRGREPQRGRWSVPGGRVEAGESDQAAVVREVLEETGLVVEAGAVVGSVERAAPGGGVYVIRDLACRVVGGALAAGDDADEVRWVTRGELQTLPTTDGLLEALTAWDSLPSA